VTFYEVVAVDNAIIDPTSESNAQNPLKVQKLTGKSWKLHNVDFLDKESMKKVFAQYPDISCVKHFAALKAV
jgi:UDP-glucose 4-epimerase